MPQAELSPFPRSLGIVRTMKHDLSEIETAYLFASASAGGGGSAYINKQTGEIYLFEESGECLDNPPDDVHENPDCIAAPDKLDLELGTALVHQFIESHAPEHTQEVRAIFSRKGAYRRFRNFLDSVNLLDDWHKYENSKTLAALREWCNDNGIELSD